MVAKPIGQILKEMGIVSEFDIQETLREQKAKDGALMGQLFLQRGLVSEADVSKALARQHNLEFFDDLDRAEIPPEVVDILDANTVETFMVMPVEWDGTTLTVCIAGPDNLSVLDDLRFTLPKIPNFKAKVDRKSVV